MATLHIEHQTTDYATWRAAFDSFADARRRAAVRAEQIQLPTDDEHCVVVDLEFDTTEGAKNFLHFLESEVWNSSSTAPGLVGTPRVLVLEAKDTGSDLPHENPVTFINLFEVPEGRDDAFLELWQSVNRYMSKKDGYLDHRLHRARGGARHRFVNVARWANPESFVAAHDEGFRALVSRPEWAEFSSAPALFDVVHWGQS
jgi:heme-degrading monooxygenase HmoA